MLIPVERGVKVSESTLDYETHIELIFADCAGNASNHYDYARFQGLLLAHTPIPRRSYFDDTASMGLNVLAGVSLQQSD